MNKDELKESLTESEITKILLDLGSEEPNKDNQGNLVFTTVCHNGDSKKLYFYKSSLTFYCYTHCHESKDIYQLIMDAKKSQGIEFTFPDALRYVGNLTGKKVSKSSTERSSKLVDDFDWLDKFDKKPEMTDKLPEYNENVLDVYAPYNNEWVDEGISLRAVDRFEIKYYIKRNQIVFPNRDIEGRLIGIRSRNLDADLVDKGLKYVPTISGNIEHSFPSAFNLYGLYQNKEAVERLKQVLLFEGEKSVLKADDMYNSNNFTVAVLGSNISDWQRNEILKLGVEEVFIAFDKFRAQKESESDEQYNERITKYQERLKRLAYKFSPFCRVYVLWDFDDLLNEKDSPIDGGQGVFESIMKNKIEIKTKGIEL